MKRIALVIAIALAPLPALAGTTGWMTGTVRDLRDGKPVPHVLIVASSPTQIAQTTTDSHGRYCILSLTPDTYFVDLEPDGYQPVRIETAIFADMPNHLSPGITSDLSQYIRSRRHLNAGSLVQEGTSGDVYGYDSKDFLVAPPVQTDYWMLRMLPGVSFGPGAPAAH